MIIKLYSHINNCEEWGLLEFQGELVGELAGKTLGRIDVLKVSSKRKNYESSYWSNFDIIIRMEGLRWKLGSNFSKETL